MSDPRPADASASQETVRLQLNRILSSPALAGSDQLKRFLSLVVERTLEGRSEMLKEYNLGLEVFQRPPDYDPKVDPIVRVQARRLRAKLEEFYATEGAHDPLVILIPKGAYVPLFERRKAADFVPKPADGLRWSQRRLGAVLVIASIAVALLIAWFAAGRSAPTTDAGSSIAVLPLKLFSQNGDHAQVANQVTEVLTTALAKRKELRVVSRTTASRYGETNSSLPEIAHALGARWVVEGGVGMEGSRVYLKLRVVDSRSDRKVWADVFDFEVRDVVGSSERAAERIAEAVVTEIHSPRK